jgi:hypothetical protein
VSTPLTFTGSPSDRARVWVDVYGEKDGVHGKHLYSVWARSAESAKTVLADAPANAEMVYLRGPGVPERVWRDAVTRSWRSR